MNSTNVPYVVDGVAADISRLSAERILKNNPYLSDNIARTLRLDFATTADVGERLYRLFVTALICQRGGKFKFSDSSETLVIKSNFDGDDLRAAYNVPSGYTFGDVKRLKSLAVEYPGVVFCPDDQTVVPGIDAVVFKNNTLYLMQFNYYASRAISPEVLRFMWDVTRGTRYQPTPSNHWVIVLGGAHDVDASDFSTLCPVPETWEGAGAYGFWHQYIDTRHMRLRAFDEARSTAQDAIYDSWGIPYESTIPIPPPPSPVEHVEDAAAADDDDDDDESEDWLSAIDDFGMEEQIARLCEYTESGVRYRKMSAAKRLRLMSIRADIASLGGPLSILANFV